MSAPSVPSLGVGIAAVFRLQLLRIWRGNKLRLGIISTVMAIAAVGITRYTSDTVVPSEAMEKGFTWGFFRMLVFLLPFLFTSGAIAEEVENRTFPFLTARPVGRFAITTGKFAAGTLLSIGLLIIGAVLLHVIIYAATPTALFEQAAQTTKVTGALVLVAIFYCAVCTMWGALVPEAAGIVAALYLAVVEFGGSLMPGVFRVVSMNFHAQEVAGMPKTGLMSTYAPDISPAIGSALIAFVTVASLTIAAIVVQVSEYRFSKA